jgi:hypothetical protein
VQLNQWLIHWQMPFLLGDHILLPLWAIVVVAGFWWITRLTADVSTYTRLANVFSACLLAMSLMLMATAIGISPWIWQRGNAAADVNEVPIQLTLPDNPPYIYLLVFDRYASTATLREDFGFDNSAFLEGLRERGFQVMDNTLANYPKTELAMTSVLNLRYHGDVVWPKSHYRQAFRQHLVGRLLTEQGYRYHHFGNLHNGLRSNAHADFVYRFSSMPSELTEHLFRMTPAYVGFPTKSPSTQTLDKFSGIAAVPAQEGPKFVYGHFLVPHIP